MYLRHIRAAPLRLPHRLLRAVQREMFLGDKVLQKMRFRQSSVDPRLDFEDRPLTAAEREKLGLPADGFASYVKHVWIVADKNRIPVVFRATLTPEAGRAFVGATIRLGETGDVRAIAEQSDGINLYKMAANLTFDPTSNASIAPVLVCSLAAIP